MGLIKRLFKVGESKANKAVEALESQDPVATVKQVIIDLEAKRQKALESQASIRAREIQLEKDVDVIKEKIEEWFNKAKDLKGRITEENTAAMTPLLKQALQTRENLKLELVKADKKEQAQEALRVQIQNRVKEFSDAIQEAKDNIEELESRKEAADAHKEVAEQLGDNGGTGSAKELIDRMNKTVTATEAYAEALTDLEKQDVSLEDQIAEALGGSSSVADDNLMAEFEKELK